VQALDVDGGALAREVLVEDVRELVRSDLPEAAAARAINRARRDSFDSPSTFSVGMYAIEIR